jgi:hypothetical protein
MIALLALAGCSSGSDGSPSGVGPSDASAADQASPGDGGGGQAADGAAEASDDVWTVPLDAYAVSCVPQACADLGVTPLCGFWPDGCGRTLDCGPCDAGAHAGDH